MINTLVLISLGLFLILMIGRSVILAKKGIKVWVINKSSKSIMKRLIEILLVPGLLSFFTLIVTSATDIFTLPYIWEPHLTNIAGIILCNIGLVIFFGALLSFGEAWRIGVDEHNSDKLITSGLFRISRNPIFLFMDMYWLGITLVYPTVLFAALLVAFSVGTHLQIRSEEAFLRRKFGAEYEQYCKRTRRYL